MSNSSPSWEYVSLSLLCKGWPDFFFQFFSKEVTEVFMKEVTDRRKSEYNLRNLWYISHKCHLLEAQADARQYEREIEEANQAQIGLANMQTQFAALDSEFQIIITALAIFANTWAYDFFFPVVSSPARLNTKLFSSMLKPSSSQTSWAPLIVLKIGQK